MITLNNITKKFGARTLFEEVTITFNAGHRYGLTGPNGAGKSTLLKILMGLEEPTSGKIVHPNKLGYLRQDIEAFRDALVLHVVMMGNKRLWAALDERDRLYGEEMTEAIGIRLGELEEVIADEEGYTAESAAEEFLIGMAIDSKYHYEPMSSLPTDLQFRVMLCQALFGNPLALILDEPTNHLDLEAIGWLENFLTNYKGCLIVVSHDRHFLNAITTDIADIDYETIITYHGNYDQMLVAKTSVRESAEQDAKSREKKISQLQEFVAKFGAGTRASQVQSRIKEIERLQPQELKKSNIDRPYIRFYPPHRQSGQIVFRAEKISKGYENTPVIKNFTFEILRGDKVAVIGNNGRGKTTLLKMLAGVHAQDSGHLEVGHQVDIGYCPQNHHDIVDKTPSVTAFKWLKERKEIVTDQEVRSILGKMLFSGDDAFKVLSALSGGETARLILGGLMLLNDNTLILDEASNHLDLEAVSALSWAIQDFKGTAIFATHDRDLISKAATKIIAFEKDGIHFFEGPYDNYTASRAYKK